MRGAILGAAALLALSSCGTDRDWQRLEERWVEQAGYHPLERYPPREANAAARRLEEILSAYGFRLAPAAWVGRRAADPAAARLEELDAKATEYLQQETAFRGGQLPAELDHWLDELAPALAEVRSLLRGEAPPRWELNLDEGHEAEPLDFLGHLRLHRVLRLVAAKSSSSNQAEAAEWLADARRLQLSLEDDPRVVPYMISLAETKSMQRALRSVDFVPPDWQSFLPEQDVREKADEVLRLEIWLSMRSIGGGRAGEEGAGGAVSRRDVRAAESLMDDLELAIVRVRAADLREHDLDRIYGDVANRLMMPNLLDLPVRASRTEFDLELTRQVVDVRERLQAGDRPESLVAEARPSKVAPAIHWERVVEPGFLRIRAVGGEITPHGEFPLPVDVRIPVPSMK